MKIIKIQFYKYEHMIVKFVCLFIVSNTKIFTHKFYYHVLILIELYFNNFNYFSNFRPFTYFSVVIPETV